MFSLIKCQLTTCSFFDRDAVRESSLNFLVNNPPDDLLLLDRIVFELISFLFLHPRSCDEGIAMAGKLAGLNSLQHPFISGLKAFLKKKGIFIIYFCVLKKRYQELWCCDI